MKTQITQREARELEGIRTLAKHLNEQLDMLVTCMAEIVGEELDENNYGHSADFIYGSPTESVRAFLKQQDISISKTKN